VLSVISIDDDASIGATTNNLLAPTKFYRDAGGIAGTDADCNMTRRARVGLPDVPGH
jgi:hypothetical protein